jgi:hypothetical protein
MNIESGKVSKLTWWSRLKEPGVRTGLSYLLALLLTVVAVWYFWP